VTGLTTAEPGPTWTARGRRAAAHGYLNAPVIVIWDNLPTRLSLKMQALTTGHPDWLTVIQLPAYAPDLNPVEGAWSIMKKKLGNLAPRHHRPADPAFQPL
jgi:transposase